MLTSTCLPTADNADGFCVTRFLPNVTPGSGHRFSQKRFATLDEATQYAEATYPGDKRSMVYALSGHGRSQHLFNL